MLFLYRSTFLENSREFLHVRPFSPLGITYLTRRHSLLQPIQQDTQSNLPVSDNPLLVEIPTSENSTRLTRSSASTISFAAGGIPTSSPEVLDVLRTSSFTPPSIVRGRSFSKPWDSRPLPPAEGGTGVARDARLRLSAPYNSSSDDIFALPSKA